MMYKYNFPISVPQIIAHITKCEIQLQEKFSISKGLPSCPGFGSKQC